MSQVYVGRTKCGCPVFGCVNDPDDPKGTAQDIGAAIMRGLTIELVETTDATCVTLRHCSHKEKQGNLL